MIQPYLRFQGEVGEQATLFIQDPSGNALEFKSFRDESRIFAADPLAHTRTHTGDRTYAEL